MLSKPTRKISPLWCRKIRSGDRSWSIRLYPLLEKVCHEYLGCVLLINIHRDEQRPLAREHGVNSLPLLTLFRDRKVQQSVFGFRNEQELHRPLEIMRLDPDFGKGAGRQILLAVVRILGDDDPLVESDRGRMQGGC